MPYFKLVTMNPAKDTCVYGAVYSNLCGKLNTDIKTATFPFFIKCVVDI